MFLSLSPAMIGVQASLATSIRLAAEFGFDGVGFSINEAELFALEHGPHHTYALFSERGVRPGTWGLPFDFRGGPAHWQEGLEQINSYAQLARALDAPRTVTHIMPGSNEFTFDENFAFHVERLRPIAERLAKFDCRLGLEFIGPKTTRDSFRHEFIYTMEGALELASAIGTGNVGLLVDSFHLFTSGGSMDDVRRLSASDVVDVRVNDAIAGRSVEEQLNLERALPGETGVLDLTRFLHALRDIGYDGPVAAEPFSQRLKEMPANDAVCETAKSMHAMWERAGLSQA